MTKKHELNKKTLKKVDFSSNKTLKIHRKQKSEKIKQTRYARKPLNPTVLLRKFPDSTAQKKT